MTRVTLLVVMWVFGRFWVVIITRVIGYEGCCNVGLFLGIANIKLLLEIKNRKDRKIVYMWSWDIVVTLLEVAAYY